MYFKIDHDVSKYFRIKSHKQGLVKNNFIKQRDFHAAHHSLMVVKIATDEMVGLRPGLTAVFKKP